MATRETQVAGLDEVIQTRISTDALRMLGEKAARAGIKNGTWIRNVLYRELGLLPRARGGGK